MADLRVEILLPLYYNPTGSKKRRRVEGAKYLQTYEELYEKFEGCTIDNSPTIGGWKNPRTGKMIKDENVAYWVVCKSTVENLNFFKRMKKRLKERFMQDDLMMYYIRIYTF